MAVPWPRHFLLEFIEMYKSMEILWNSKMKEYHDKDRRRFYYNKLANKVKEIDPKNANIDYVIRKINSLRCIFRKEYRKVQDSIVTDPKNVRVPKLWYYDYMTFTVSDECSDQTINMDDDGFDNNERDSDSEKETLDKYAKKGTKRTQNYKKTEVVQEKRNRNDLSEYLVRREECELQAKLWAVELLKMDKEQMIYAKKAINDIIFEGVQGNLQPVTMNIENKMNDHEFETELVDDKRNYKIENDVSEEEDPMT